jgi:hypothetical protein
MDTFCTALCDYVLKLDPTGSMAIISECLPVYNPFKEMSATDRKYFMMELIDSYSEELEFGYSRYKSIENERIKEALTFNNDEA